MDSDFGLVGVLYFYRYLKEDGLLVKRSDKAQLLEKNNGVEDTSLMGKRSVDDINAEMICYEEFLKKLPC